MSNEELVEEYQNGNHQALDELVKKNEKLVFYFANKYSTICPKGQIDKDDLIQEGMIGLCKAANKYIPNRSDDNDETIAKFSTYAARSIKGKILRSINKTIAREKKSDIESEPIRINSINSLIPGSDDTSLEDMIPDEESTESFKDIERNIDNEILRKDLLELLDSLFGSEFEFNGIDLSGIDNILSSFTKIKDGINAKEVLLQHYGLIGKPMTHKEIGEKVGLSGSRIEQIEYSGIGEIRRSQEGQYFMKKYEIKIIEDLTADKDIKQQDLPEKVITRMETIDNLLKQYI